jgi:hypothetical protein
MDWINPFTSKKKLDPPLAIADTTPPEFKQGDLVMYTPPYASIIQLMAIVDSYDDNTNKYEIYVLDTTWNDAAKDRTNINKKIHVDGNTLKPYISDKQKEYNPDLFLDEAKTSNTEKYREIKKYKDELKKNIKFIENMPENTFSDFAIAPKRKKIITAENYLNEIKSSVNILDANIPLDYKQILYGNIIVGISKYCDDTNMVYITNNKSREFKKKYKSVLDEIKAGQSTYEALLAVMADEDKLISIDLKENIISGTLKVFNFAIGVSISVLTLDRIYATFTKGHTLIVDLYRILPNDIKREIIHLLYITIFTHFQYLYDTCNDPVPAIKRILAFIKLLFYSFIGSTSVPILLPGATLDENEFVLAIENLRNSPTICDYDDFSDVKNSFENPRNKENMTLDTEEEDEITAIAQSLKAPFSNPTGKQPRGGKKQKTRKINKTKHNKNKRTNKSNKKLPKKRRQ